ncbi:hypothetical protein SFRURICE_007868 [Spodoptera frugiperda]|nr:hypothetical protein SFRURICE_007868 [Spodoptera frugiperda]
MVSEKNHSKISRLISDSEPIVHLQFQISLLFFQYLQRHAFYPRRQRYALRHVMPLFTIYVISPILRATTEKFLKIRKKLSNNLLDTGIEPESRGLWPSASCNNDHSTNEAVKVKQNNVTLFYPRRGKQRCTLWHVMPLYNEGTPTFHQLCYKSHVICHGDSVLLLRIYRIFEKSSVILVIEPETTSTAVALATIRATSTYKSTYVHQKWTSESLNE